MHSLPLFVKLSGRPVILLGRGDAAAAKRRLLDRAGADVRTDEDAPAALAVVALEDEAAARAAAARLKARGVLVNAPDRPDLCDFTLPAVVDRDPVLIAVGTGGASAGLAKAVRQRLEALLPASLGDLAAALGRARAALRTRWPDAGERRRALDAGLAEGGALDPLQAHAPDAVARWLGRGDSGTAGDETEDGEIEDAGADAAGRKAADPAPLIVVALSSNDPDDLTLGTARRLGQAECVFHQAGVSPAILARARADAARREAQSLPDWPGPGLALWLCRAEPGA